MKYSARILLLICGFSLSYNSVAVEVFDAEASIPMAVAQEVSNAFQKYIAAAKYYDEVKNDILSNTNKYFTESDIHEFYSIGIRAYKDKKWNLALINLSAFKKLNKKVLEPKFSKDIQAAIDYCIRKLRETPHKTIIQKANVSEEHGTSVRLTSVIPTEDESIIYKAAELNPQLANKLPGILPVGKSDGTEYILMRLNEAKIGRLIQENQFIAAEINKKLPSENNL